MWQPGLPRPGLKPVSPALAGGFLTSVPPGKPWFTIFKGYTTFIVTIKYWLYSLCCTIYPCSLFDTFSFVSLNSPNPNPTHLQTCDTFQEKEGITPRAKPQAQRIIPMHWNLLEFALPDFKIAWKWWLLPSFHFISTKCFLLHSKRIVTTVAKSSPFNQVMKINITRNGINGNCVLPEKMHWEEHSICEIPVKKI